MEISLALLLLLFDHDGVNVGKLIVLSTGSCRGGFIRVSVGSNRSRPTLPMCWCLASRLVGRRWRRLQPRQRQLISTFVRNIGGVVYRVSFYPDQALNHTPNVCKSNRDRPPTPC